MMNIIKSYLSERLLIYNGDEEPKKYRVTGGGLQGSILGPILWNVLYDGIQRLPLRKEVQIVGYADDIAVTMIAALIWHKR